MRLILILLSLLLPTLAFAQKLPGNFTCQDLIDAADGKASRSADGGRTYVPIKTPHARDASGQALLAQDTYQCRRLARGEITVEQFDALRAERVHQVADERRKVLVERKVLENQERALQNQQRALQNQQSVIQTQREAVQVQRQAATIQALQAEAARRQQRNPQNTYGEQGNSQQLIQACGAKGMGVDFVTGNCVSPQGGQINPHNLYQPFTAPLPQPNPNELIMRCGAQGRAADFATGRCM